MALEIEHKFLVADERWRASADGGRPMRQGYLSNRPTVSVRVRSTADRAWISVKQAHSITVRNEYEYAIPLKDAKEMLDQACDGPIVEKTRYLVKHEAHVWEVDVFHGDNEGLVVAEVELSSAGEPFARPSWLGQDVSEDPRYLNQNLARMPYRRWASQQDGGA